LLESLITSKTRVKILLRFFANTHATAYLRSLADEFGESTNSVRYELNNLSDAGILNSRENGRTIEYQANIKHPLFPEIQSVVHKYLGLDQIVEKVIEKIGDLQLAFITGDYAVGKDSGIIDLILVGNINRTTLRACEEKAEKLIKRKIRSLVLTQKEYTTLHNKLGQEKAIMLWNAKIP